MKKVLVVGPYSTKGRFSGGISAIINDLEKNSSLFSQKGIEFVPFNTCFVKRSAATKGHLSIANIMNYCILRSKLLNEMEHSSYYAVYIHSSIRLSLLKDLMLAKKAKKHAQIIIHIHSAGIDNILGNNKIIRTSILRHLNADVSKIILLSQQTLEEFSRLGIDRKKLFVVPNFSSIRCNKMPSRPSADVTSKVHLLFIGSIDSPKGIFDLLKCLNDHPELNVDLTIGGSVDEDGAQLKLDSLLATCKHSVFFKGYLSGDQKEKALLDSDVLVLPSYSEGFPVSIVEGMSFGEAIISTDVGAIPEIINASNGFLLHPGDSNGIYVSIRYLCEDRTLLISKQQRAFLDSAQYTITSFISRISNIID